MPWYKHVLAFFVIVSVGFLGRLILPPTAIGDAVTLGAILIALRWWGWSHLSWKSFLLLVVALMVFLWGLRAWAPQWSDDTNRIIGLVMITIVGVALIVHLARERIQRRRRA